MYQQSNPSARTLQAPKSPASKYAKKKVRIIKKIRTDEGIWKFVSLDKVKDKYVWGPREGYYFLEWWDGKKRCRELAGHTPCSNFELQSNRRSVV